MNASEYWALFLETGAPEAYTAYCSQPTKNGESLCF